MNVNGNRKLITHSMLDVFKSCRRKYEYRYLKSIVPIDRAVKFEFGKAVHAGLENWFLTKAEDVAVSAAENFPGLTAEDRIKAAELVRGYINFWGTADWWDIITIEGEFEVPLRNPDTGYRSRVWNVGGRIDGLVETPEGLFILEHKTVFRISDDYVEGLKLSTQPQIYAAYFPAADEIDGVIFDILQKPGVRPKKEETEEEFRARCYESIGESSFCRKTVHFSQADLERCRRETNAIAGDIQAADVMYPNTSQCAAYGGCEYLPLCKAGGELEKCLHLYRYSAAHSELEDDDE